MASEDEMLVMNDKELLELAAKAAGIEIAGWNKSASAFVFIDEPVWWNPLTDDGDALRLAVKLNLWVYVGNDGITAIVFDFGQLSEEHGDDPYAATRRAIVRAAAEIGRTME